MSSQRSLSVLTAAKSDFSAAVNARPGLCFWYSMPIAKWFAASEAGSSGSQLLSERTRVFSCSSSAG